MKVIGLTDELRGHAEKQCAAGFRAWLCEAETGTWSGWDELKKHYPEASQTGEDEAHFPLTADGTGIRAMIFFKLPLMMLLCIAPAPVISRPSHRRQTSLPQSK